MTKDAPELSSKANRKRYLINPRFQLKYVLIFLVLSSIVAGFLGARLYASVRDTSLLIQQDLAEVNQAQKALLKEDDQRVLLEIMLWLGALVISVSAVGVLITHKVAGPAFVLTRNLRELAAGRLPKLRPLRRNDELHDLMEALDGSMERIRRQLTEDLTLIELAEQRGAYTGEAASTVAAAKARLRTFLDQEGAAK